MVLYITLLALPSSRPECHTREMHCLCILHIMVFGVVIYSNHTQQLTQICETVLNNSISLSSNIFIINNIEFLPMTVSVTVSATSFSQPIHAFHCDFICFRPT